MGYRTGRLGWDERMSPATAPADRAFACEVCGDPVAARTMTSPHPEAPELVTFRSWPWLGIVSTDPARLIVCCGIDCARELLRE